MVYLNFKRAFNTISHNILLDKLMRYKRGTCTAKGTENCLNCWVQRVVVPQIPAGGQSLMECTSGLGPVIGPIPLNTFINN